MKGRVLAGVDIGDYNMLLPTRPAHAQFMYTSDRRKVLMEEGMKMTDATKQGSAEWNELSEENKKSYEEKAEKLKEEYVKKLESIRDNGYFLLDDGTKSSEIAAKEKKMRKKKKQDSKGQEEEGER